MLEALSRFPESCGEGIDAAEALPFDALRGREFKAVVVAGVGGSAIGGHLLHDWLIESCPLPIYVSRGYRLSRFVDDETLVFTVSYSGNTEETLAAFDEALGRQCPVIALTSGGELRKLSIKKKIPLISLPGGMQPRAALPNQFFSMSTVMSRLALASDSWGEVGEALKVLGALRDELVLEKPTDENPAKRLALELRGLVPFVYGPRLFEAVAYRIRTQLNENAKVPAGSGSFPEAFHNAVMGREGPEGIRNRVCALLLRDPGETPTMRRKIDAFRGLLEGRLGRVLELEARGRGRLARMMSALYVGDYASTYLGLLYGLDPSSTDSIAALKRA